MSTIICHACGAEEPRRGQHHKFCEPCSTKRRRKTNRACASKWRRTVPTSERTAKRSAFRAQQDQEYGHCVYKHVDPVTGETVYVGSGAFTRATSCRCGGGFQRTNDHAEWYKRHRRNGTIQTYHDYAVIVHRNVPSREEAYLLEGQLAIDEIVNGARLFNRELPNPSRRRV